MNYTNKVCSFTGYRTQKLNFCLSSSKNPLGLDKIRECLKGRMIEMMDEGFNTFQCGMAIGADIMFAETALELRETYPALVKFIAVIPCIDHDKNRSFPERELCNKITERANDVIYVSNTKYYDGCMAKRNRYLVETCDELLAVYDGQRGGTMQTVNYAKGKGIKVTIIDPSRAVVLTLREFLDSRKSALRNKKHEEQ